MAIQITRRLEFDAGHRIPDHGSQCRHLHGHRYAIEVTVEGPIHDAPGRADNGMVLDFSDVKTIVRDVVVDPWDHAFLVWRDDAVVRAMLSSIPNHKTVVLDRVPTAENLAAHAFELIDAALHQRFGDTLTLVCVRLYETPNCWSDAKR
ncbi:MAG TPA: 6-carboxytetrahydropterin synthase QueD [Burkholderiaceae bacterium]|nr:6-carboxytetrahydropterin synthase QueD [Burkholderiaceae bacterium]